MFTDFVENKQIQWRELEIILPDAFVASLLVAADGLLFVLAKPF